MNDKSSSIKRLDAVLAEYEALRKKSKYDDLSGGCMDAECTGFETRAATAILSIAPKDSLYAKRVYGGGGSIVHPQHLVGIIKALKADLEAGHVEEAPKITPLPGNKFTKFFLAPINLLNRLNPREKVREVVIGAVITGMFGLVIAFVTVIFGHKGPAESKVAIYNVNSNYQAGGVTASIVNMQKPARHFNEQLRVQLLNMLPKEKYPIILNSAVNDREAYEFAAEIEGFLKEQGWTIQHNQAMWSPPITGQEILPLNDGKITINIGSKE